MQPTSSTHETIATLFIKRFQSYMHMYVQPCVLIQLRERVCTTEYQRWICMCWSLSCSFLLTLAHQSSLHLNPLSLPPHTHTHKTPTQHIHTQTSIFLLSPDLLCSLLFYPIFPTDGLLRFTFWLRSFWLWISKATNHSTSIYIRVKCHTRTKAGPSVLWNMFRPHEFNHIRGRNRHATVSLDWVWSECLVQLFSP